MTYRISSLIILVLSVALAQSDINLNRYLAFNEGLSTVTEGLEATGLNTLLDSGDYTLIAPSDEAFLTLASPDRNRILANPEEMKVFLNNLIIPGVLTAGDLLEAGSVTTLGGDVLAVSRADDGTLLIGDYRIGTADVGASGLKITGGVIHIVEVF